MVDGGNSFAFNLLEAVSNDENFTGKDFMVSPLSVSLLLGAMNNGAIGQTSEEILNALGFEDCTAADINEYSKSDSSYGPLRRGCQTCERRYQSR